MSETVETNQGFKIPKEITDLAEQIKLYHGGYTIDLLANAVIVTIHSHDFAIMPRSDGKFDFEISNPMDREGCYDTVNSPENKPLQDVGAVIQFLTDMGRWF